MTKLELKSSHEVIYTVDVTDVDSIFYCKPTDPDILTVRMKDGKRLYCDEVCPLQEEPVSEGLEEAAWQYYDRNKPLMPSELDLHKELIDFFKAGVRWKEQNDSNLSEVLYRDNLDEMAEEYSSCTYLEEVLGEEDREVLKARLKNTFKAAAKWQKEQDQSIIELAEDHAMLAGMEKMKEQMMAKAVEAKVIPADLDETQFCLSDYDEVSYITAMVKAGKLKLLDKVKLVIVKED